MGELRLMILADPQNLNGLYIDHVPIYASFKGSIPPAPPLWTVHLSVSSKAIMHMPHGVKKVLICSSIIHTRHNKLITNAFIFLLF